MPKLDDVLRSQGVRAYRDGVPFSPHMQRSWRTGWIAARNEQLRAKYEAQKRAANPIGRPLIDMDKLQRMRRAGR